MITILVIFTLVAALVAAWGFAGDNEDVQYIGVCCLILVGSVGWGLIGGLRTHTTLKTEDVATVLIEKSACHLSVDGVIVRTYNDVATYNFLKDKETIKVVRTDYINMYGGKAAPDPTWDLIEN